MFTTLFGEIRCDLTESDDKEVVRVLSETCYISVFPYDFSLNSDKITSDLLMEGREKQKRLQRDQEILRGIFG